MMPALIVEGTEARIDGSSALIVEGVGTINKLWRRKVPRAATLAQGNNIGKRSNYATVAHDDMNGRPRR